MFGLGLSELVMMLVVWALPLCTGAYVVLRFLRAYERRGVARLEQEQIAERMLRLEESVSGLSEQLDQITEGQRFTTQVLAGRTADPVNRAT